MIRFWDPQLTGAPPLLSLVVRPQEDFRVDEPLPEAHIVFCESRMLLDRGHYGSWRDVQDAYDDYKTSLGPWSEAEIVGFLEDDWGPDDLRWPFTREAIADFFRSGEQLLVCQDAVPGTSPVSDGG